VTVTFLQADLLDTFSEHSDIIVANLPYVPDNYPVAPPLSFEPRLALFAGSDGMDLYRTFWKQVAELPTKPLLVATESLLNQHSAQAKLAGAVGYRVSDQEGLVQLFMPWGAA
jgi:release factor glutamine methyltransferase